MRNAACERLALHSCEPLAASQLVTSPWIPAGERHNHTVLLAAFCHFGCDVGHKFEGWVVAQIWRVGAGLALFQLGDGTIEKAAAELPHSTKAGGAGEVRTPDKR